MSVRFHDQGILLAKRPLGEGKYILTFFSQAHGQIKGASRISKKSPLDVGTMCSLEWSARLEDQLGFLKVEPLKSPSFFFGGSYQKLLALQSLIQLLLSVLVDRHPYPKLFEVVSQFLNACEGDSWDSTYLRFECILLKEMGFGLDLSVCALTGTKENLYYLSPKTGRAVCKEAGQPYHSKLLKVPHFQPRTPQEFRESLEILGHFIQKNLFPSHASLPAARLALLQNCMNESTKGISPFLEVPELIITSAGRG